MGKIDQIGLKKSQNIYPILDRLDNILEYKTMAGDFLGLEKRFKWSIRC